MVTLKTNLGDITLELDFKNTPKTAENFLTYVKDGFYDGTIFHRVINGFMIQGGGLDAEMQQKKTRSAIENEAKQGQSNKKGSVAMARTSDPHSATAQFFINVVDNDFLDFTTESANGWGYCVFGKVVEGMDVVDKIKKVATTNRGGHQNVPVDKVVIEKVVIKEEAGV
jgi:peptidyl-prolyl cis-trans isomerase B (cyclophilin B)